MSGLIVQADGSPRWVGGGQPVDQWTKDQRAICKGLADSWYPTAVAAHGEEIKSCLALLLMTHPMPRIDECDEVRRWEIYLHDLRDVTLDSLMDAIDQWRTETTPPNKFFPRPAELLALCDTASYRRNRVEQLSCLAKWHPRERENLTPAQRAEVVKKVMERRV